ncbi:MAG: PUA domain-containing protein [Candidatus Helarchaeota archaeon]
MEVLPGSDQFILFLNKFIALICYQYNIQKSDLNSLDFSKFSFKLSKRTKKLRYINYNGQLIASFRTHDGFIVFSRFGANFFLKFIKKPKMRIIISQEISEFISNGRNVFAKHIIKMDPSLRPESEVFIVDLNDDFIALGKLIMTIEDVKKFQSGVAVKVR